MNKLQKFTDEEFGEIRTVTIDGEPYFVGKDVAEALGYKDSSDALKKHVDREDKLTRCFADSGQKRNMYIINESGLYSLILSSRLQSAKKFKHWVTSEVLPSIRKTGRYEEMMYQPKQTSAGEVANLLRLYERRMKEQGISPEDIAAEIKNISEQFGIKLSDNFVRVNPYPQLTITTVYGY